jgi:alanine racemase
MNKNLYKIWVEIKKAAVRRNIGIFRKIVGPKVKLMAVIKSNAYGHGLLEFSKVADSFGADWFGTDSLSEALKLRQNGIKKPILVLGYTRNSRLLEAAKNDISLTFYNFETLDFLRKHSEEFFKHHLKVHLEIDTGMRRQGIYPEELAAFLRRLKKIPFVSIEGIYTHFASAKDIAYPFYTKTQLEKFKKAVEILGKFKIKKVIRHAAATGAALLYPESRFDMARIGIGFYGLWPSKEAEMQHKQILGRKISLKPVLAWKTIIAQVKKVKKGDFIGYDLTEKMTHNGKIAILPIGYWHGYDRGFSGIGEVLINGCRCRVLGRVSMDMIAVDITKTGKAGVEDEAALLGCQKNEEITASELAQKIGTIPYEILTCINPQTPRLII